MQIQSQSAQRNQAYQVATTNFSVVL